MKIISKHKDYYDWVVSIYGLDEIMIYNRRTDKLQRPGIDIVNDWTKPTLTSHTFSICNRLYKVYQINNMFFHTPDELVELHDILLYS